jgi:hypothetical protein
MTWNHRIVRTTGEGECYQLAEVFYDTNKKPYAYGEASIIGESMIDVIRQIKMFESSLAKEILNYPDDFIGDVNI